MMVKTKKKKSLKFWFIGLAVVLILLILNCFSSGFRNFVYLCTSPAQKFFWRVGEDQSRYWGALLNAKSIKQENDKLLSENYGLLNKVVQLESLATENDLLRQALDLNLTKDFKLLLVGIINKSNFRDSLLIDRGSEDGVKENMAAIDAQRVLFGKVSKVYKNYSVVTLITDSSSVLDVRAQEKDIYGVVRGKSGTAILDLVPRGADLINGDVLVTSNLGDVFPKDLLVGKVNEISKGDSKPYLNSNVEVFFNIESTESLFLITNFKN